MSQELQSFLFKRRGEWKLAFCRGKARGCEVVNLQEQSKRGPCSQCMVAEDENETLGDLVARMERGDA